MKHPYTFWGLFLVFFIAISPAVLAEPAERSEIWNSYPEHPEFMEHWEYGISIGEETGPLYYADLIIPLYQADAKDRGLFLEPRVNHAESETLFNLGLGYRQLVRDRTWMLGGNLFYDHDTEHAHSRVGLGTEAISNYAEFRANGYFGLSVARTAEPGAASQIIERAVDGYDLEAGFPVPYYSKLKFFGQYEWYDFKKFDDRNGWRVRAEYSPVKFLILDLILKDTNKQSTGWGLNVAFRPPLWGNKYDKADSPFKLDKTAFRDADVGKRIWIPVERNHEIVVESYREAAGVVTVEITRNN